MLKRRPTEGASMKNHQPYMQPEMQLESLWSLGMETTSPPLKREEYLESR
jgi:hypothetical protein